MKGNGNSEYIVYADTQGGCRSIRTMLERSDANYDLRYFYKKDDLQSYLLDRARGGKKSKESARGISLLFYKLLIDNSCNVSFARQICDQHHNLPVVFVMDHICYLYMLYDAGRQYYLWPPFSKERVVEAIERLSTRRVRSRTSSTSIVVSNREGNTVLPADDIIYCESVKRVTHFVTAGGTLKMYMKLSEAEEKLTNRFIRCHQSFLVNFRYIRRVGKADMELTNGAVIPVSQRKRRKVISALEEIDQSEMVYRGTVE
jgi:DNA-binding LytR/AlgR family response regulator